MKFIIYLLFFLLFSNFNNISFSQNLFDSVETDNGVAVSPERLVDICLDHLGSINVQDDTRSKLVDFAAQNGEVHIMDNGLDESSKVNISGILKLIVASPEFQRE